MPNLDIIEINEKLADSARFLASGMSEPQTRKRGLIDMLGINCAISYLQSKKLRIDTKRSIYKIPALYEEFKIADIYYNNYRIDVITLYKEKTIKIPKIHVEVDIVPDFYFVVQIGAKIKEAKIIGFLEGKSILGCSCDSKFYYPTLDMIFDIIKFAYLTKNSSPLKTITGKHTDCLGLFMKFIDDDLSNVYKSHMIRHIMNCNSCRSRFIDTIEFERVAKSIHLYPNLMKKCEHKIQPVSIPIQKEQPNVLEESLNQNDNEQVQNSETVDIIIDDEKPQRPLYTRNRRERNSHNKKVIDTIFNEIKKIELPQIKTIIQSKHRHKILAISIMLFIFITFTLISVKSTPKLSDDTEALEQLNNAPAVDMPEYEMTYGLREDNPSHQARLIPRQREVDYFDIQQPIDTAPTYSPSVANVSWEVPESLVKKPNYPSFLQLAGKNIKLNLQNELLLVRDVPINRLIKVNMKIASNGDVQSVKLAQTSGSPSIDNAITKVVKDSLRFMRPPAHGILSRSVEISLTIGLN